MTVATSSSVDRVPVCLCCAVAMRFIDNSAHASRIAHVSLSVAGIRSAHDDWTTTPFGGRWIAQLRKSQLFRTEGHPLRFRSPSFWNPAERKAAYIDNNNEMSSDRRVPSVCILTLDRLDFTIRIYVSNQINSRTRIYISESFRRKRFSIEHLGLLSGMLCL